MDDIFIKTIETPLGKIHVYAKRKATEQDMIELHDLLAELYIKRMIHEHKKRMDAQS